jgi:hypothetical protein
MKRPVRLDDQPMPQAYEVSDVTPDRQLAAELQAVQTAVSQQPPQQLLRRRRPISQTPGKGDLSRALHHEENNT